ncbi:TPA: ead/Ea22-like family protein [Salmonella enterica]
MTIDKQALRKAAEKATPGPWEMEHENIWFTDADGYTKHLMYAQQGDDVDDNQDHYNTVFIAAFNPKVALALLDELEAADALNKHLELAIRKAEGCSEVLRRKAEAAEKRNVEQQRSLDHRKFLLLSADEVQRDFAETLGCAGDNESIMEAIDDLKQHIAELESKNGNLRTIAHEQNELAIRANLDSINDAVEMDSLHKHIAELEARTVTLPQRAPENLASVLDGYEKWLIATTFRDTWNACLAEVTRMNAAGIKGA